MSRILRMLTVTLAAGCLSFLAAPVQAQQSFGNQIIQFPVDTTVEFEFIESHGAYQSSLGILDADTGQPLGVLFSEVKPYDSAGTGQPEPPAPGQNNTGTAIDFVGTVPGGSVQNKLSEFTFKANRRYSFYLESISPSGQTRRIILSTSNLATLSDGALDAGNRGGVTGVRIAWDDDGLPQPGKDGDFDDFVIEAGGYLVTVPCPPIR